MGTLIQDLRYAVRMLAKNRSFTIIAVIALALGIGANTVIFSVINAVLLRSLPFEDPDRLVMVWESSPQQNSFKEAVAPANYLDWKAQSTVFETIAAYREDNFNVTGGDRPERVIGAVVTPELFQLLGVKPLAGRVFDPEDQAANAAGVVISRSFWVRHFASDPNVVGQKMIINSQPFTVIGITPAEVDFPDATELWTAARFAVPEHPLQPGVDLSQARGRQYMDVIARVKSGVTLEQAQTEMDIIGGRLAEAYPATNMNRSASLKLLREHEVSGIRTTLFVLFGAVGFVLLIACANVANLLMARAASRRKEIAIRVALGATRSRIARQLLTESVVLSLAGGTLGLLIALWGIGPLVDLLPSGIHGAKNIRVDAGVLAFTISVSLLTALVFGLLPALQASRTDLNESLKEGGRGSAGGSRTSRIRAALVVSEIALSLVLLVGAGLLIRSFIRLHRVNAGFQTANITTMRINLSQAKYHNGSEQAAFFDQVLQQILAGPEVESAAAISRLPLTPGNSSRSLTIEGRAPNDNPLADLRAISPDYFKTMGIPLQHGRDFSKRDNAAAPEVAIINELAAGRIWPDENPIGKRLQLDDAVWLEVVGVVGNVKHLGLDSNSRAEVYVPYLKRPWPFMSIVARGRAGLADAMQQAVWAVDKEQPVANLSTMEQLLSRSVTVRRFNMLLLGVFAAVALALAAVGIYGVISYSVSQRTHEIGVRLALGATAGDVLRLITGQGMTLALIGVAIGVGAALALTRVMASLLFEVTATDLTTFVAIPALLIVVALAACLVPARRALKVDPMVALRYE